MLLHTWSYTCFTWKSAPQKKEIRYFDLEPLEPITAGFHFFGFFFKSPAPYSSHHLPSDPPCDPRTTTNKQTNNININLNINQPLKFKCLPIVLYEGDVVSSHQRPTNQPTRQQPQPFFRSACAFRICLAGSELARRYSIASWAWSQQHWESSGIHSPVEGTVIYPHSFTKDFYTSQVVFYSEFFTINSIWPNGILLYHQVRFPWNRGSHFFETSATFWGKSVVWGGQNLTGKCVQSDL